MRALGREEFVEKATKDIAEIKRKAVLAKIKTHNDLCQYLKNIRARQIKGNWRNRKR